LAAAGVTAPPLSEVNEVQDAAGYKITWPYLFSSPTPYVDAADAWLIGAYLLDNATPFSQTEPLTLNVTVGFAAPLA
jgi:hypothetical protein